MIVKLFAVVDRISGVFDGPHKGINEGEFLRNFSDACTDPKSRISKHPEDFYVVELGSYNDANGDLIGVDGGARRIADAADFVRNGELDA